MRTLRTVAEVRAYVRRARAQGRSIGLVPTMGAFHEGHLALMRAARNACDEVFVSLFVNPTQFNEPSDLAAYPRAEREDAAAAAALGVDVLFAPPEEEIYPQGFATSVEVAGLSDVLEGEHRGRGHFSGVCTVVAKLLNIVAPDVAYFGQKDAQQVVVVRTMVRDLDIPVRIEALPTVREHDGLALSSRNRRLGPEQRRRALALYDGLRAVQRAVAAGERDAERARAAGTTAMAEHAVEPEYLAVVDADTLAPMARINGRALVAVAAKVGDVRLIDNIVLTTNQEVATLD